MPERTDRHRAGVVRQPGAGVRLPGGGARAAKRGRRSARGDGDGVEVTVEGEGAAAASGEAPTTCSCARSPPTGADARGPRHRHAKPDPVLPRAGVERGHDRGRRRRRPGVAGSATADPLPAAAELEGHPDNVAAALLGGLTLAWTAPDERAGRGPPGLAARSTSSWPCPTTSFRPSSRGRRCPRDRATPTRRTRRRGPRCWWPRSSRAAPSSCRDALDDRLHEPYRAPFVPLLRAVREPARRPAGLRGDASRAPARRCSSGASGGGAARRPVGRARSPRRGRRGVTFGCAVA